VEHNLLRHPYTLTSTTLLRSGYVFLTLPRSGGASTSSCNQLYQFSRRHPRTYFHTFFKKQSFKIFFGPFPRAPGARHPHFRIPLPALRTLGFFPASPPLTLAAKRWSLTSNVTPTPKPPTSPYNHLHPIVSGLNHRLYSTYFLLYRDFTKVLPFKKFFGPFPAAPVAQHHFRIPLALRTLGFFPPPIYAPAKRWSLTSYVTPTLKWFGIYRGDQHVARTPYLATRYKDCLWLPTRHFLKFLPRHFQPPMSPLHHTSTSPTLKCVHMAGHILLPTKYRQKNIAVMC